MSRWRIADRLGLARAITDVIQRRHAGSVSGAAKALRLPSKRSTLSRLRGGRLNWIDAPTFAMLEKLLGHDAVRTHLVPPEALRSGAQYEQWLERETYSPSRTGGPVLGALREASGRHSAAIRTLGEIRRRGLYGPLGALLTEVTRDGHSRKRGVLAVYRAIRPLIDSFHAGPVERQPHELSDNELRQLIYHGVRQERIMIRRASSVEKRPIGQVTNARRESADRVLRRMLGVEDGPAS